MRKHNKSHPDWKFLIWLPLVKPHPARTTSFGSYLKPKKFSFHGRQIGPAYCSVPSSFFLSSSWKIVELILGFARYRNFFLHLFLPCREPLDYPSESRLCHFHPKITDAHQFIIVTKWILPTYSVFPFFFQPSWICISAGLKVWFLEQCFPVSLSQSTSVETTSSSITISLVEIKISRL